MARVIISGTALLAAANIVNAVTMDLPVIIQNTYSSVPMQIGTPPKTYRLLFDTGSSTTWILNNQCQSIGNCNNLSGYDRVPYVPSESSTYEDLGPYSVIPYIDGDGVGGEAVQDILTAPQGSGTKVAWEQTFLSTNQSSWVFIAADGFLGLGFSSIAEVNTSSMVETMMQQGLLDQPRFGLYYGTNMTEGSDGILTIGGSKEETYVDGEVRYVPLNVESPYELWRTPLLEVIVTTGDSAASTKIPAKRYHSLRDTNEPKSTTLPVTGGRVVFDTGAGRVSLPSDIIADVYQALGWNLTKLLDGEERFTCEALNATWAISFVLGDDEKNDTFEMRGNEFISDQCMPPVDDTGVDGFALLGSAFLQRHYSVFDFGATEVANYQPRIGFGKLKKEYDFLCL